LFPPFSRVEPRGGGGGEVEVNRMAVNAEYVRLAVYCSVTVAQSSARQEVFEKRSSGERRIRRLFLKMVRTLKYFNYKL
jgi:hypothetical protein